MASLDNPRILIVDDDIDFANLLRALLENEFSARVTTAGDCASARLALSGSTFEVVTMDYELPDGNGVDVMEELVAVPGHPPVVMVTGKGDEPTAARACLLGAAGYVVKDKKLNAMLVSAVRSALEHVHSAKLLHDSEVRYRRLFESARDGILILDAKTGLIIDANPFLTELLGYRLDEIMGRRLWEIGPFKDVKQSRVAFEKLMEKRYVRYENLPLETKDGRAVAVEFVSNIYMCDHSEVIQCNIRDITVRKRKELVIEESESWYRALYESSTDCIVSTDMEGYITGANSAYCDMLGYGLYEVRKLTYQQLTPEKWHTMEQHIIDTQVTARGYSDIYEKEYVRKDGSVFPISIRTWLIKDGGGNPAGMWAIVRDITEQKEAEEELQRAYLELEGFSHTVSHDLRGPLASIGLGVEMTRRILSNVELSAGVRSELEDVLSLVTRSVERSGDFIESMLALAEAGQVPGDISPVDIGVVVRNALEENAERMAADGITVDVSGDLGSVRASPTHMYQLFANLIGNAIAHNDSDCPRIEVTRLEEDGRGGHRYLVRDNGSGVQPEYMDRIFVPFFKGESGDTGIGLSTVEKIVKVYGGSITAYNDGGACFEFRIMDYRA